MDPNDSKIDSEVKSLLTFAGNLDPSLLPELEEVFKPKGDCPVAKSPNFVFIICGVLKSVQPRTIAAMLWDDRKEKIPWVLIRDYILKYIPPKLTKPGIYSQYMASRFAHLDETDMLENIAHLQYARLTDMLESGRVHNEDLRREIDLFGKLAKQSVEVKVAMGRIVPPQQPIVSPVPSDHSKVLKLDSREASNVLRLVNALSSVSRKSSDNVQSSKEVEEKSG